MTYNWTTKAEKFILKRRGRGDTYNEIALELGTTASSVKHKVTRLQQNANEDRYKHTAEKIVMAEGFDISGNILETHCGFGGMTDYYKHCGNVESYDIKRDRVDHVKSLNFRHVKVMHGDTEKLIWNFLCERRVYDVIDIDPYGLPSRYFPYVFGLINDGLLFLTFPVMGVAQMNKITIRHYEAFWGITLDDKDCYVEKITKKLEDYAFMFKREIRVVAVEKIDRIYRFAIRVEQKSLLDIVGLKVRR